VKQAAIILALDTEVDIAHCIGVSRQTIQKVKKDFETAADLKTFLQRKKRETPSKVIGEREAPIIALACSKPPEGYTAWTLQL
jgi:transposase